MVQIAKALGAGCVVAVDIDERRLQQIQHYGADVAINATGKGPRDISTEIKAIRKQKDLPGYGWKIFEVTGSKPGQETALGAQFYRQIDRCGLWHAKTGIFHQSAHGFRCRNYRDMGMPAGVLPTGLGMVLSGKIDMGPFVQTRPMSTIAAAFEEAHHKSPDKAHRTGSRFLMG